MFSFQQICPLCNTPIHRGDTVVQNTQGMEVHAGCYIYEQPCEDTAQVSPEDE